MLFITYCLIPLFVFVMMIRQQMLRPLVNGAYAAAAPR